MLVSCIGENIASNIKAVLQDVGLGLERCRGQAYDGASNMSGEYRGTAAIIRRDAPKAVYQHCQSHILNLVLMKLSTAITEIGWYLFSIIFIKNYVTD